MEGYAGPRLSAQWEFSVMRICHAMSPTKGRDEALSRANLGQCPAYCRRVKAQTPSSTTLGRSELNYPENRQKNSFG